MKGVVPSSPMRNDAVPEIDVHALAEKIQSDGDFLLVDVREEWELARVKITDERMLHVPLSRLSVEGSSILPRHQENAERSMYVICHHGLRSSNLTRWLMAHGWRNVYSVRGGVDEYARKIDPSVGFY